MDLGPTTLYLFAAVLASVILVSIGLVLFVFVAAMALTVALVFALRSSWLRYRVRQPAHPPVARRRDA